MVVATTDRTPGGTKTLTSFVYSQLRSEILSARLYPGQKLNISELAKRFSVSLAAVREGLSRLVADGLVDAFERRGFRVAPVSAADLEDITQTRIEIESLAIQFSIQKGDDEWLVSVRNAFETMDGLPYLDQADPSLHNEDWIDAHRTFHSTLVSACSSPWLLHFRDILQERTERYRRLSIPLTPNERDLRAEHLQIVEAVLSRDADAARNALSNHFLITMRSVSQRGHLFDKPLTQ